MDIQENRKHFSRLGMMYFVGMVIIYGVQTGVMGVVGRIRPEWLDNADVRMMLGFAIMYLIGMPALILLVRQIPADKVEKHTMTAGQFGLAFLISYALVYISNIVGLMITMLIGLLKGSMVNNVLLGMTEETNPLFNFFYMVICAPIMEEYIFRKLIVDRCVRYGQGVAVVLSGLIFGLFHANLNQFVYAFTLGCFLAFLYARTGNIKYTIGIHMIINFMGSFVALFLIKSPAFVEYEAAVAGGDMQAAMASIFSHMGLWFAFALYLLVLVAVVITGVILMIVFRRRFVLEKGEIEISKGQRFRTVIWNAGMVLFCLACIGLIIRQLFT